MLKRESYCLGSSFRTGGVVALLNRVVISAFVVIVVFDVIVIVFFLLLLLLLFLCLPEKQYYCDRGCFYKVCVLT